MRGWSLDPRMYIKMSSLSTSSGNCGRNRPEERSRRDLAGRMLGWVISATARSCSCHERKPRPSLCEWGPRMARRPASGGGDLREVCGHGDGAKTRGESGHRERTRSDPRRGWNGERGPGALDPCTFRFRSGTICEGQLCGDTGNTAGKRVVRIRERRFHRGARRQTGKSGTGGAGDAVPGRNCGSRSSAAKQAAAFSARRLLFGDR
jgi:hypothetical protein